MALTDVSTDRPSGVADVGPKSYMPGLALLNTIQLEIGGQQAANSKLCDGRVRLASLPLQWQATHSRCTGTSRAGVATCKGNSATLGTIRRGHMSNVVLQRLKGCAFAGLGAGERKIQSRTLREEQYRVHHSMSAWPSRNRSTSIIAIGSTCTTNCSRATTAASRSSASWTSTATSPRVTSSASIFRCSSFSAGTPGWLCLSSRYTQREKARKG